MTVRPMVLAVRFGPKNVDATRFAADEWTRGDVSMQVRRAFVPKRLCLVPSEWVRIFGVRVGPDEVLSANPDVSVPSAMFPIWTIERAELEGFSNLSGRVAYPGDSITVSFEYRPVVFLGLAGVIFGDEWQP